ncbi:MAG: Cell envelope-related transcriptional attenuator [Acetothermia bacterium 64_32]|nr:MAG: Cell envelope-related transcriptional attenuator [Acetothermia bacterium 64_32]HAF70909.1 hypothetical protein [Candidatus Acetothermia bacterium]
MRWLGIAVGLVLIGVAVGLFFLYSQTDVERALHRGEWVHVLVVGVDSGAQGLPQADLVGVASLSPEGRGVWLSLPRDLSLPQADGGWRPLYAVYSQEGVEGVRRGVARLLEVQIPYVVEVGFAAFSELVELVGGVDIAVEAHLVYVDQSQDLYIDIPAGLQHLDGQRALDYVRYRGPEGEEGRIRRSHKFLRALLAGLRGLPWSRWRDLAQLAMEQVTTNLDLWEALALAHRLRGLGDDRLAFAQLPSLVTGGERRPDLVHARQLLARLYQGRRYLTRDQVEVVVLNGTGAPFLAHRAEAWLLELGFSVVGIGNADRFDYAGTLLVAQPGAEAEAQLLARILPVGVEIQAAEGFGVDRLGGWPEGADLVLILGEGFHVPS